MLTVKGQLIDACKDALKKLEWPIYTKKKSKQCGLVVKDYEPPLIVLKMRFGIKLN